MPSPKVAIITRTMNRPLFLERALKSILAQTFEDWQWVVVNSGDESPVAELIARHSSALRDRVLTVRTDGPGPIGRATNTGIDASASEYITLLDDDDTWHPNFLETTVARLDQRREPEVRGVVTWTLRIDEEMQQGAPVTTETSVLNPGLANLKLFQLASVNQFTVNAFLFDREAYEIVGPYRDDLPVLDDWEFNLRFLRKFDIDVIPESLANYHVRPAETEGNAANSLTAGEHLHKFYEARIVNGFLRDDLESGTMGFGFLMSIAAGYRTETDLLRGLSRKLKSMSAKIGRVDSRTKLMKDG